MAKDNPNSFMTGPDAPGRFGQLDKRHLHDTESPDRVAQIRARHGLPGMQEVGVGDGGDMAALLAYSLAADPILLDAKPPKDAGLAAGNGLTFDWRLVSGRRGPRPWRLSGGRTPQNMARAILLTPARQVDVSSGVESAPGAKDPARIADFAGSVGAA